MKLSRSLFLIEEVKYMIKRSLIKCEDIIELYFWFNEYYQSILDKNKVWSFVYEIYYELYAIENKDFIKTIQRYERIYKKTPTFATVLSVLKNMFYLESLSINVLSLQMIHGKKIKLKYKTLVNDEKIKEYFRQFLSNKDETKLFELINSVKLSKLELFGSLDGIPEKFARIHLLCDSLREIHKNKIEDCSNNIVSVNFDELKKIKTWNSVFTDVNIPLYRKLVNYVKYGVDTGFTCLFKQNQRFKYSGKLKDTLWYEWEGYDDEMPLWIHRSREIRKNNPEIDDEDFKEMFYELYNYEIDEQPKWIQEYYGLTNTIYKYSNNEKQMKEMFKELFI